MAEALGAAVLAISVDDTALRAGLAAAEQQATRTAQTIAKAFEGIGGGLSGATVDLKAYREELERLARAKTAAASGPSPFQKPPLPPPIPFPIPGRETGAQGGPSTVLNSLEALQTKLQFLRREFASVEIGSEAFRRLQGEIQRTEEALQRVGRDGLLSGQSTALNSIDGLQQKLSYLRRELAGLDIGSEAFRRLQAEIQRTEASLSRVNQEGLLKGQSTTLRSLDAIQQKLGYLRQQFGAVEIGSREFQRLQGEIRKTEQELSKVGETLNNKIGRSIQGFGANLLGALGVGVGVGAGFAVGGFLKGSVDAAVQLETVTRKLTNTLGEQGAAGALTFTRGLADQLGLSFKDLAGGFSSFTAAATAANVPIEVQRDLFASVAKAGQALGLSNYEINGSLLALQQVASKGTVQMEELRGQLGERLPIALSATARGLGLSQRELIKLVESGKLTAAQFFPALSKGLNELTAGAGGIPTAAQNFAKLGNAWDELQTSFGTNLLPSVTQAVIALTAALEGPAIIQRAQRLGFSLTPGPAGIGDRPLASSGEAGQLVGTLRQLQTQYALTETEADAAFNLARIAAGATKDEVNGLKYSTEQYAQILETLPGIAKKIAAGKPVDVKAQEEATKAAEEQRRERERLAEIERQKGLDRTLTTDTINLELRGIQARIEGAKKLSGLQGEDRQRAEDRLAIEDKLRAAQQARLALARELEKAPGTGDGKDGTQSATRVAQLEGEVIKANLAIDEERTRQAARLVDLRRQEAQELRALARSRGDSLRDIGRQISDAQSGINSDPRRATERLTLGLGRNITDAAIAAQRAGQELARARGSEIGVAGIQKLRVAYEEAGKRLELAAANAGEALRNNAREAAKALTDAISSRNATLRGNFEFLTAQRQQEQIALAQQEVAAGVRRGDIRGGLPTQTVDQLFGLANVANQIKQANEQVKLAENLKGSADAALKNAGALFDNSTAMASLQMRMEELIAKQWAVGVNINANGSASVSGDASLAYR